MFRLAAAAAALLCVAQAHARTLTVGEGKDYPLPSAAIAAAQDGDTILIEPGQYFDCAIVGRQRLTIAGARPGAVITDKACEGKGLLVIRSTDVTIRDLTLARARVPDENGAGIRLEGPSLTLQRVTFDNDQVGLLSGSGGGEIRVEDCTFIGGGVGGVRPKYAVLVGGSALLRVERSTFRDGKGGQVSSAAAVTELVGNSFGNGAGDAPAEAVLATEGHLLAEDNTFTIGPNPPRLGAAIAVWDDATATLRHNRLVNHTGQRMALLLDWSFSDPTLDDNTVSGSDRLETSSGLWRHRASTKYHETKDSARAFAGQMKRLIKSYMR